MNATGMLKRLTPNKAVDAEDRILRKQIYECNLATTLIPYDKKDVISRAITVPYKFLGGSIDGIDFMYHLQNNYGIIRLQLIKDDEGKHNTKSIIQLIHNIKAYYYELPSDVEVSVFDTQIKNSISCVQNILIRCHEYSVSELITAINDN